VRSAFQDAIDAVVNPARRRADAARKPASATVVANYVTALFDVYIAMIFVYTCCCNMIFRSAGTRLLARGARRDLGFLRDVSEPYLRIFRKRLPADGTVT
jgi:uncharacterized protein YggT (Ycf19 family)